VYLVIVGVGDIGTPLVDIATGSGNEVVVIERSRERAEEAADESIVSCSTTMPP
jgi:trk system potassium uptake protein TrkA